VRIWTVHLRDDTAPVLVREGFSLGGALFGPVWLAFHRAWLPAIVALAAWLLVDGLASGGTRLALHVGLMLLIGVSGRDLCRWSLARRGFVLAEVVAARDTDRAFQRLLDRRRDLGDRLARAAAS
jgi:hypothetical protein